jgi:hypothetical protein
MGSCAQACAVKQSKATPEATSARRAIFCMLVLLGDRRQSSITEAESYRPQMGRRTRL